MSRHRADPGQIQHRFGAARSGVPATFRRVLAFLDLACERFFERDSRVRTVSPAQVRQPVNARGLGRWRSYERHLQPLIAELNAAGVDMATWPKSAEVNLNR